MDKIDKKKFKFQLEVIEKKKKLLLETTDPEKISAINSQIGLAYDEIKNKSKYMRNITYLTFVK